MVRGQSRPCIGLQIDDFGTPFANKVVMTVDIRVVMRHLVGEEELDDSSFLCKNCQITEHGRTTNGGVCASQIFVNLFCRGVIQSHQSIIDDLALFCGTSFHLLCSFLRFGIDKSIAYKKAFFNSFLQKNKNIFEKRAKIPFTKNVYYVIIYITIDFL